MKKYDAIIIGFGKGGKTLALELAKRDWKVAMIERSEKMYGGTCINIGCIPTKTLIYQAKLAQERKIEHFEDQKEFYRQAIAHKEEVISLLRDKNYHNLADQPNIIVYTGEGSFVKENEVQVEMADDTITLQAPHIFINTGATTVIPPISGITESKHVYTSTTIMELPELPRKLIIVGGGYIGLEFASMYASFGSEVTVLESFSELIPHEDRDIADCVQTTLEKKGIIFRLNANVQTLQDSGDVTRLIYKNKNTGQSVELEADAILLATGRKPVTSSLNLEIAGVKTDDRGTILVDEHLKTSNPNIYAIGDVKGGLQFTYISLDDFRIIRDNLFGSHTRTQTDRTPVSYSVFIDPPLSRIGISEAEAKAQGLEIKVKKIVVSSIPRTHTIDATEGLLKAIVDAKTNKILGCTLFCTESSEVINTVAVAMKAGMDYTFLRDFIFTHPTMSETFNDLFNL